MNSILLIAALLLTTTTSPASAVECTGPAKYPATGLVYDTFCGAAYYECVEFSIQFWWWYVSSWTAQLKICPFGQVFDAASSSCLPSEQDCPTLSTSTVRTITTTTTNAPTTSLPVTVPECKRSGKHPALLCYQYYECVPKWWWYEPQLKTCAQGTAFDASTNQCGCAGLLNCSVPVTEPGSCTAVGTYSDPYSCHQYYECSKNLLGYRRSLKECPIGQNYDTVTCNCVDESLATCTSVEPECYGFARYPATEKNQYYECQLDESGLKWVAHLETCYAGYVFSLSAYNCVKEA